MKKEIILTERKYTKDKEKFESIFKIAIEEYLKNYNVIYRQERINVVKYM